MSTNSKSEEWKILIEEFNLSKLTAAQWCSQNQKPISRLRYWLHKFKYQNTVNDQDQQWISIPIKNEVASPTIIVKIASFQIEIPTGFDKDTLAEVLETVQRIC